MVFTASFWPKYKRVQYEQSRLQMAQKLNSKPKIEAPQNAPIEETESKTTTTNQYRISIKHRSNRTEISIE